VLSSYNVHLVFWRLLQRIQFIFFPFRLLGRTNKDSITALLKVNQDVLLVVNSLKALFYVGTLAQIEFKARSRLRKLFQIELGWWHFNLNVEVFVSFCHYYACCWVYFALFYQLSSQLFELLVEVCGRLILRRLEQWVSLLSESLWFIVY